MTLHLLSAYGREGVSYTCKEQAHVFVNLCIGAHSRAGIARNHFLFDGNGWWKPFDKVAFGLAHTP